MVTDTCYNLFGRAFLVSTSSACYDWDKRDLLQPREAITCFQLANSNSISTQLRPWPSHYQPSSHQVQGDCERTQQVDRRGGSPRTNHSRLFGAESLLMLDHRPGHEASTVWHVERQNRPAPQAVCLHFRQYSVELTGRQGPCLIDNIGLDGIRSKEDYSKPKIF